MNKKDLIFKLIDQHYAVNYGALAKRAYSQLGEFWHEDCVQDTYERAYRYWEKLPIDFVGIHKYLQVMLNNRIRDYRRNSLDSVEIEEAHWESGELADEAVANKALEKILEYLKTFPERNRGIIYTHLIQGERIRDVANIFDVDEGNVKFICSKFREDIRGKFSIG